MNATERIERIEQKSEYWFKAWQAAKEREAEAYELIKEAMAATARLEKKNGALRERLSSLEEKIRALMDETEIDGEGALSRDLRKEVWTAEDSKELAASGGLHE
jgi:predicted  nucleic acid-binding Zn-ribbon protein